MKWHGGRDLAAGQDGRHRLRLRRASGLSFVFLFILCVAAAGAGLVVPPRGPWRGLCAAGAGRLTRRSGRVRAGLVPTSGTRVFSQRGGEKDSGRSWRGCAAGSERVHGACWAAGWCLGPCRPGGLGCRVSPVAPRWWGPVRAPQPFGFFCRSFGSVQSGLHLPGDARGADLTWIVGLSPE
ncbi:hypothetical protein NDU88_005595 [Pleurodeles waltl]|uniref:Uncharacterized protein n=1 Tax=Pleurodeles waltl TaxID=8319 RepID=A0AAV7TCP2_PLEWA|nr:hypothetical protein NDU88_005595 [Pleurodeles waltl]